MPHLENKESRFHVIPKATIRPGKVVYYNQFVRKSAPDQVDRSQLSIEVKKDLQKMGVQVNLQPEINAHNFEISKKAAGRIKEKVTWLYTLSKNKTVQSDDGRTSFAFRMNFLTLTLPAAQEHTTAEITSVCLNQFLTECKDRFGLRNYVWRLEFQKNGNAHYHIATDCYIEFWRVRSIWNRCVEKLGYISKYARGRQGLTLGAYCKKYNVDGKTDFNTLKSRYTYGVASRWSNPKTVDIVAVTSAKNIAFYISKYITKKSDHTLNKNVLDREPLTSNLRLWFCSRTLSRLDKIEVFLEEVETLSEKCIKGLSMVKRYIFDYVEIHFFNDKEQVPETRRDFWLLFHRYAVSRNYFSTV